jgi:hypothetical protein
MYNMDDLQDRKETDTPLDMETEYMQTMIEGWFFGTHICDICRDNMASWTSWAFFGKNVEDLSDSESRENQTFVDAIEEETGHTFAPGYDPTVVCARLTLDPVFAVQVVLNA